MNNFINTKKEIFLGDMYFKEHVMPYNFDYKRYKKEINPLFSKYGFCVSKMYQAFYSMLSGIDSDHYMSMDLYYFYVLPALNKYDFKDAWLDKNIYTDLFPDAKQPKTIIKNMNGLYFTEKHRVSEAEAVNIVSSHHSPMIIKPTIRTCNGEGVRQIDDYDVHCIFRLFREYNRDYIVQEKVEQHDILSLLNATSLNTIRLFTYRNLSGYISFLDNSFIRFGGKGAIMDNASAGGCLSPLSSDGVIQDDIYRFKEIEKGSLFEEKGIKDLKVPAFDKAIKFVIDLHERLPYFDFVGWDVYIDKDCNPSFVEFNLVPSCEGPQMIKPLFGDYFEEVLTRAANVEKTNVHYLQNTFNAGGSVFYLSIQ